MTRLDFGKRALDESRIEKVVGNIALKLISIKASSSSVPGPVLYKKDVSAVLKRWMAISSSQNISEGKKHSVGTLHCQKAQRKMRERAIPSRGSDMGWNRETNQLPSSVEKLMKIYSDKTGAFLGPNAIVLYPVFVVSLDFTERSRRFLANHGYALSRIPIAELAERRREDEEPGGDEHDLCTGLHRQTQCL